MAVQPLAPAPGSAAIQTLPGITAVATAAAAVVMVVLVSAVLMVKVEEVVEVNVEEVVDTDQKMTLQPSIQRKN